MTKRSSKRLQTYEAVADGNDDHPKKDFVDAADDADQVHDIEYMLYEKADPGNAG